jgi:hypothetical protein
MRRADTTAGRNAGRVAPVFLMGVLCWPAYAAVYHCTSATGETLFTDTGCPPGFTTTLVVPDPPAPAMPTEQPHAAEAAGSREPSRDQVADAELARLKVEAENARLRSELDQERLRAIDRKLDALLDAEPVYGAVGVLPLGVVPKPFPLCKGRKGETPWVDCRPERKDRRVRIVPSHGPSCGIVGCTPSITRRPDADAAPRRTR